MHQAIEAVWKNGQILPLEPMQVRENSRLMVVILDSFHALAPSSANNDTETFLLALARHPLGEDFPDDISDADLGVDVPREELD